MSEARLFILFLAISYASCVYSSNSDPKMGSSSPIASSKNGDGNQEIPKFAVSEVCDRQKCQSTLIFQAPVNPANLQTFINQTANLPPGTQILLNSQDGDLSTGIRLGQIIRQKKFNTRIGRVEEQKSSNIKIPGVCSSSCALAFLGGTQRQLDEQDEISFYPLRSTRNSSSKLSEEELKKALANIDRYFEQMNINGKLLEQIMQIEGDGPLIINSATARAFNIENASKGEPSPWRVITLDGGISLAITSEKQDAGKFNITLGLSQNTGNFRLTVLVKPTSTLIDIAQLTDQLNKEQLILSYGGTTIKPKLEKIWQTTSVGSQAIFILKDDDVRQLASQLQFSLQLTAANINNFDLGQNTLFTGRGLSGAIPLLKNKGL